MTKIVQSTKNIDAEYESGYVKDSDSREKGYFSSVQEHKKSQKII